MKKLIGIGIAAMMVMGLAGAASAAAPVDTAWYVNMKASTDTLAKAGASNAKFGVGSALNAKISAGYDPTIAEVVTSNPGAYADRWNVATIASASFTGDYVWNFRINPSTASSTVYLTAWNPSAGDLADDYGFQLSIYQVVGGQRAKDALYTFDGKQAGAWSSTAGVSGNFFQQGFSTAGPLDFQLVATAVPEPGSIVAMLSGLVGLAGFGIRRRK